MAAAWNWLIGVALCFGVVWFGRVWSIDPIMAKMYALDAEQLQQGMRSVSDTSGADDGTEGDGTEGGGRRKRQGGKKQRGRERDGGGGGGGGGGSPHPLGGYCDRLTCVRGTTEDFDVSETMMAGGGGDGAGAEEGGGGSGGVGGGGELSIVLAVHSHCPLSVRKHHLRNSK